MSTSALVLAVLSVSTFVTAIISGILGMAGGMLLMGVFLAVLPLPAAMLLHGIVQFASNGGRAVLLRDAIDWRIAAAYAAGAFVTLGIFALFAFVVDKSTALIVLGLSPLVAVALPRQLHLDVERRGHAFACGAVCLVFSLTAGVSGPILDAFFIRSTLSRHTIVATKAVTQSLGHLLKIAYFGGVLTVAGAEVAPLTALLLVLLAVLGTAVSRRILERISDGSFRRWTRWTMLALGAIYLISGVSLRLG